MEHISRLWKGALIGIATLVPGVSGGTMAILLGVYEDLMGATAHFFNDPKNNFIKLIELGLSAALALLACSSIMLTLLNRYTFTMQYVFLGIIIGGLPALYHHAENARKFPLSSFLSLLFGILLMIVMDMTPSSLLQPADDYNLMMFFQLMIGGAIIAVALVLPGISASFMLLMLGIYDTTLIAIKTFDLSYLIPIAIGGIIATILSAKAIDYCMKHYPRITYMIILGFVAGSIITLYPGLPQSHELLITMIALLGGFSFTFFLGKER